MCFLGHGVCEKVTRLCLCEAFWMQNLIRKHFGDGESNCGELFQNVQELQSSNSMLLYLIDDNFSFSRMEYFVCYCRAVPQCAAIC